MAVVLFGVPEMSFKKLGTMKSSTSQVALAQIRFCEY